MSIDWSKPIEAVHEDGRVVPMIAEGRGLSGSWATADSPDESSNIYWEQDGRDCVSRSRWRIRNVADDSDTVTIKRATIKEWEERFGGRFGDWATLCFQEIGLIKPDPTPAEQFKQANPEWALRDRSDLIEDVLSWKQ